MFKSCICVEPDENASVKLLSRRRVVARKQHTCGECWHTIHPGQTYEADATVFEKLFTVYKTCLLCVRVRDSLMACSWYYGAIWPEIHQALCDDDCCICPD